MKPSEEYKINVNAQNPEQKFNFKSQKRFYRIQGLKSGSSWSIGLPEDRPEHSIQNTYLRLIERSKKFVYLENQFCISSTAGEPISNRIIDVLAKRICRAIDEKKKFVAFIVLPLLPGFGGNIT